MNQEDRLQQAADALSSVSGQSPVAAKRALSEYDTRDLIASVAAEGGGAGASAFATTTGVLNNADIKALPTVPFDLLEVAADKVFIPLAAYGYMNLAVPYSNVGATAGGLTAIYVQTAGDVGSYAIPTFDIAATVLTIASGSIRFAPRDINALADSVEVTRGVLGEGDALTSAFSADASTGVTVQILAENYTDNYGEDLGDFEDGDAANSLTVTLVYALVDAP